MLSRTAEFFREVWRIQGLLLSVRHTVLVNTGKGPRILLTVINHLLVMAAAFAGIAAVTRIAFAVSTVAAMVLVSTCLIILDELKIANIRDEVNYQFDKIQRDLDAKEGGPWEK